MKLEIYSDGSGNTMEGTGGYGYVLVREGVEVARGSGFLPRATNNVAEITAAIKGLEHALGLPDFGTYTEVSLVSDSQLVLRYATGEYKCKAMHLVPLYIRLRSVFARTKATTRWVKGHSGEKFNEACDELAKTARKGGEVDTLSK
jgi:ribonuclease HI